MLGCHFDIDYPSKLSGRKVDVRYLGRQGELYRRQEGIQDILCVDCYYGVISIEVLGRSWLTLTC